MKMLVAGANGAIGRFLVPALVRRGHDVAGMVRKPGSAVAIEALGATPVQADALDLASVISAFERFRPDVVLHEMTALSGQDDLRHFDRAFAPTNQLRTRGTDNLLEASRHVGSKKFVTQSFGAWPYARVGGPVKSEDDPLDDHPPRALRAALEAIKYNERTVLAASGLNGVALRYGGFYGPGTALSATGSMTEQVRRRKLPLLGSGAGVWSFVHIADAAAATALAAESDFTGVLNVADDEPAPASVWLPFLAQTLGAKPPLRIPGIIARLVAPEHIMGMMTTLRGCANARAREVLGWQPCYPSWRQGFRDGL